MPTVYFSSLPHGEVVDVEFISIDGSTTCLRLLVDSGFTGSSSFVLPDDNRNLIHAEVIAGNVTGALTGLQKRGWLQFRVGGLGEEMEGISIFAETTGLSLPDGVSGLAGLTFLRKFQRWGAELQSGVWKFFISDG